MQETNSSDTKTRCEKTTSAQSTLAVNPFSLVMTDFLHSELAHCSLIYLESTR